MNKRKVFPVALLLATLVIVPATPALSAPADGVALERLSADTAPLVWLSDLLVEVGSGVSSLWQKLGGGNDSNGKPAAELADPVEQGVLTIPIGNDGD